MNTEQQDKEIREQIVSIWESGGVTWREVAHKINSDFYDYLSTSRGLKTGNACRKIYGRYKRQHKNKPIPTITRERKSALPQDKVPLPNHEKALIIGDTHKPFVHPGYLDFLLRTRDKYKPDIILHIGDVIDSHAVAFWDADPDGHSARDELNMAREELAKWAIEFPELYICIGNHDARPMRKLFSAGIPFEMLKGMNDILETPSTWRWENSWIGNGVRYEHGRTSGMYAVENRATALGRSVVMGHTHTTGGVKWITNDQRSWFGMNVGCGLDTQAYVFRYARNMKYEPTLGCGVVLDSGQFPIFVPFLE